MKRRADANRPAERGLDQLCGPVRFPLPGHGRGDPDRSGWAPGAPCPDVPCRIAPGTGTGYREVRVDGRRVYAHRWAWEQAHGPIPPGMGVLHCCDNPPCVEVAHLFLGTQADNMADMRAKGRHRYDPHARLTPADVAAIRAAAAHGATARELAQRHGVVPDHVRRIVRGLHWADVA